MKILFLADNFPPEVNAPAARTLEHCRRWVQAGADVTVVTCAPNFPKGKVFAGYKNRLVQRETIDGIRVIRVWSFIAANQGFFLRVLDHLSFAATSFFAGLFASADIIVATSPQFFTTFAGFALSLIKQRPWIFEVRDLWPESVVALGLMRQGRLLRLLERTELFLYRRASRVVVVTNAFRDNLTQRGIAREKIDVVPNGVDLSKYRLRPRNDVLRQKLNLADRFVFGYIGTHGMAHGLDFIVEAAASLRESPAHFLFVGDGAGKRAAIQKAASLGLTNVTFHDAVPREDVPAWLSACDAALIALRRSETFKSVIPSKIFEAAGMGLPILLGVDGQARAIVEQFDAGLFFEPENKDAFRGAVLTLLKDSDLRARSSAGGLRLAAAYDRDLLAEQMYTVLERAARAGRRQSDAIAKT